MKKYILKRLLQLVPVLIGITFLSFAMMRIAGSDAVTELYGDKGAVAQEVIDAKRAELGLDRPFMTQYLAWLGGMLRGDMGTSYVSGRDVLQTFVSKLPATLMLTALSVCATVVISIPLGILAAVAACYAAFRANRVIAAVLKGMEAGVAALVADMVVDMSRAVFRQKDPLTIAIVPLTFIACTLLQAPVLPVLAAGAGICFMRGWIQGGKRR